MALIGKIRKNFWFVLILLGLALAAFILMDMTSAGNAGGVSSLTMGSVAGQRVDYGAFQRMEQAYYQNAPGDAFSKRKSIWDFFVEDALVNKEADALGLTVPKEELMDLQFGTNRSDIIKNNWLDQQTGQWSPMLDQFKALLESGDEINPKFRAYWYEQEKHIVKDKLQNKLNSLVSKSVYTPNWLAEEAHKMDNTKVDFNYVKVPFDYMDGAGIEVSDADLLAYAKTKNDKYYVNQETREVEYATFEVFPSAADSAAVRETMTGLISEFQNTDNDSIFAISNNGMYNHLYATPDQLPEGARSQIQNLNNGEIYGPFSDNGFTMLVKMIDKRAIPDSVKARHILISASEGIPGSYEAARTKIDSIRGAYRNGSSFSDLAAAHSSDGSNKDDGGQLAVATQTTWVPEFTKVAFGGREGGLYTVKTQFGIHLLEVQDQIFNAGDNTKYKVATVGQPITPSQETQDAMYDKVTELMANNKDIANLRTAASELSTGFTKSIPLRKNDFNLGDLGGGQTTRDLIQWAFEPSSEIGDVSPEIYKYSDPVNYYDNKYVVATLSSVIPQGMQPASVLRNSIGPAVLNKKKAEKFAAGLKYGNLQEVATATGGTVETASDVGSKSGTITGIGREAGVLANAFGLPVQAVSTPIVGETGVFIVQPISKQEATAMSNAPLVKNNMNQSTKSQVNFSLIKNMIKRADIKDERATFF